MAKANDSIKVEALKLRESGQTIKQIVAKTGLSKSALLRHFKKHGVIKSIVAPSVINNDNPENPDSSEHKMDKATIINDTEVSEVIEETPDTDTYKGTKVTFDSKKSAITIESSDIEDIVGTTPTSPTSPTPEPVPGSYTKPREIVPKQDMDINRPEDPLDTFFSRGMIETLIPIGLIVAGYVMKKSENSDRIDKRGEDW